MSSNNVRRKLSFITSIAFIFVSIAFNVGIMTEDVYAASAFTQIEAENYSSLYGTGIKKISIGSGSGLGYINDNEYAVYNALDFGSGAIQFKAKVATTNNVNIQIKLDSSSSNTLATLSVNPTGSWDTYNEVTCNISNISGIRNLYLVFSGSVNIDWFIFTPSSTPTQTQTPTAAPTPTATYNTLLKFEAESRNEATSGITSYSGGTGTIMGNIQEDNYMAYYGKELGLGVTSFKVFAATTKATTIEIRTDSIYGPLLGTLNVASTGSFDAYQEMSCSVSGASDKKNIYLVFGGPVNVDWFSFTLVTPIVITPAPTPTPSATPTPVPTPTATYNTLLKFEAESRNEATSGITSYSGGTGTIMGNIQEDNYMAYYGKELGLGVTSFKVFAATTKATTIEIRTDSIYGPLLGTLNVASTGSFDAYQEMSCSVSGASDKKNIYLVFGGPVNLDWCSFTLASPASSISAFSKIEAENFSSTYGSVSKVRFSNGEYGLAYIESTDLAIYNNLDFGSGAVSLKANIASSAAANIEIRIGGPNGSLIGNLSVPSTGSFDTFTELYCSIGSVKNINNICLVFSNPINIDWFTFIPSAPVTSTPTPTPTATPITRSAYTYIQAESYNSADSDYIQSLGISNGTTIGYLSSGDSVVFKNIDFGTGAKSFTARLAAEITEVVNIEIRSGSPTGTLMGTLNVPSTDSWDNYQEASCEITNPVSNVNDLYLVFTGPVNLDWFIFTPKDPPVSSEIDAYSTIQAEICNSVSAENIKKLDLTMGITVMGYIQTDDFIVFNNVNFGSTGAISCRAAASNSSGSTSAIEVRSGSSNGEILGTLSFPSTSSWNDYTEVECTIPNTKYVKNLYLVFKGPVNFDWFIFSENAAITPPPTPTPTPTVPPTPTPSPTPLKLDEPDFKLERDSSASVEIGSNITISEKQRGTFNLNGLGSFKSEKEIILIVDNSKDTNAINVNETTPLDFAIYSNSDLRAVGDGLTIIGDVCVNNTLETHISKIEQVGTCFAGTYKVGYGCEITGDTQILTAPVPMPTPTPGFSAKLIKEADDSGLRFKPNSENKLDEERINFFREKTGFDLRYESDNNLFVITGAGSFNLYSSMYFEGNLRISVPHTVNTNSCFLVADGYIALEGHDINTTNLDQDAINNTTNLLNVYSIYGKIQVSTERCKLYGILYAEGVQGNPLYPYDNGVVCLQGQNNTIYGSIVAGGDVRTEGSLSTYTYCSAISSRVTKKYLQDVKSVYINDLAKRIIDKFAVANLKVSALQYSDSANDNKFELYDISSADKLATFKTNVIEEFPATTSGHSNLGDALRRARHIFADPSQSSPDADKFIVVLVASAPNKWTSEDATLTEMKQSEGDAAHISGDGTIDSDGKAFNYAVDSLKELARKEIRTFFIEGSSAEIGANINSIAQSAVVDGVAAVAEVAPGRYYYTKDTFNNIAILKNAIEYSAPLKAFLKGAEYEQKFPVEVSIKEFPEGWECKPVLQPDGTTPYVLKGKLDDVQLNFNGTDYDIEEYTISYKAFPKKLGDITFAGTDSKITYTVTFVDLNGLEKTVTFEKSFNDLIVNVKLSIDVG